MLMYYDYLEEVCLAPSKNNSLTLLTRTAIAAGVCSETHASVELRGMGNRIGLLMRKANLKLLGGLDDDAGRKVEALTTMTLKGIQEVALLSAEFAALRREVTQATTAHTSNQRALQGLFLETVRSLVPKKSSPRVSPPTATPPLGGGGSGTTFAAAVGGGGSEDGVGSAAALPPPSASETAEREGDDAREEGGVGSAAAAAAAVTAGGEGGAAGEEGESAPLSSEGGERVIVGTLHLGSGVGGLGGRPDLKPLSIEWAMPLHKLYIALLTNRAVGADGQTTTALLGQKTDVKLDSKGTYTNEQRAGKVVFAVKVLLAGATDGEKALLQAAVKSGQSAGLDPLLASLDQRMRSNLGGIVASVLEDARGKVNTLLETAFESWSTARAATTGAARVTANSEASTAAAATIPPVDTFAAAQGFDKVCAAVSRIQFTREKGEGGTLKVKRTDFLDAVTAVEDALRSSVVPTPTLTLLRTAIKDASAASALLERHAKKALSQPPLLSLNINQIDDLVGGLSARQKQTDWRAVLLKPHGEGSGGGGGSGSGSDSGGAANSGGGGSGARGGKRAREEEEREKPPTMKAQKKAHAAAMTLHNGEVLVSRAAASHKSSALAAAAPHNSLFPPVRLTPPAASPITGGGIFGYLKKSKKLGCIPRHVIHIRGRVCIQNRTRDRPSHALHGSH
jgi:hypothetical protein